MLIEALLGGAAVLTASNCEPEAVPEMDISFDVALVSDYRRNGVSHSDRDPALQAAIDVSTASGWSFGAWGSTIAEFKGADVELELYGGKSFDLGETELSLGVSAILFPGGDNIDFAFARSSISRAIGPIDATLVVNYAWEQANLNGEDNIYVGLRARTPVGRVLGVPLTAGASIGRAEGRLAVEGTKLDWSLSLTADVEGTDIGLSFVDTDLDDERGEAGLVLSIARTF